MVKAGKAFEPPPDVVLDPVMPPEFIEQLEQDAGTETVNLLDVTLAPKTARRLISEGFANIYSATSL